MLKSGTLNCGLASFILFIFFETAFPAQNNTGFISGTVIDYKTENVVAGVLIHVEGNQQTAYTSSDGSFSIVNLSAGTYNLITYKPGYYSTVSEPVMVKAGELTEVNLKLLNGDPEKYLYFSLGGITVTAERDLLPQTPETVYEISSGEIEHIQATNLGDLLDLLPGNERKNQPGLQRPVILSLRGISGEREEEIPDLFGTKIIVDDIPVSNNSNLNSGDGVGYGSDVFGTAKTGIDLRTIPADNIENVTVVPGMPSVEYGDVSSGIIKVKTATGAAPFRLKAKYNPDIREVNLGGGFKIAEHTALNLNVNDAYSMRDLRLEGDEVNRVGLQAKLSHRLFGQKLSLEEKAGLTRFFEDYRVEGDPNITQAYNHDFKLFYGQTARFRISENTDLHALAFLDYTRRKSYKRRLNVVDPVYVTGRMSSGTQEGVFLHQKYFYEITTTGEEYSGGLKLNLNHRWLVKGMVHNLLAGAEFRDEANRGPGKQFNPLLPISLNVGIRPRSFEDVPDFKQLSFYLEDRFTARLLRPFTFSLGVRAEAYNPQKLDSKKIIKSQNGTFWNPRTGILLKLTNNFQVRGSYGIASKAPGLASMYPDPLFVDVLEYGRGGLDTLVTTYKYRLDNPHLKGYTQTKKEVALDYRFQNIGISITGFREETAHAPVSRQLPYFREVYSWPNWPSPEGKALEKSENMYIGGFSSTENLGWLRREGFEFVLKTRRIDPLNMMFRISGGYNFKHWGRQQSLSVSNPEQFQTIAANGDTTFHEVFPVYPVVGGRQKKFIMNYNLDYINKRLGIWLTFTFYHKILDMILRNDFGSSQRLAAGYFEDGHYYSISPQNALEYGLVSEIDGSDRQQYHRPATFYFNLTVSKRLYDGAEFSLFVNNFFNERNFYFDRDGFYRSANPEIFYGIEFSSRMEPFAGYLKEKIF